MPRPTSLPLSVPLDKLPPKVLEKFNSAPIITSNGGGDTATITIDENISVVTAVAAFDANTTDYLVYTISGGLDASLFQIDPNTGLLSFKTTPDYERAADVGADNHYNVVVSVSDGIKTDSQAIEVVVNNTFDLFEQTPYVVMVLDTNYQWNTYLGVDAHGNLTNNPTLIVDYIAMTESAAYNVVGQKFNVLVPVMTPEAADPFAPHILHWSDAMVQTAINMIP